MFPIINLVRRRVATASASLQYCGCCNSKAVQDGIVVSIKVEQEVIIRFIERQ